MRGVKRIRPLICHPGRWHHSITSRSNGFGLLALVLACGGGLVLARCELSRDQARLNGALAAVPALTRTAVAVSDSIGVPSTLSVKIIEAAEGVFRDVAALSRDAAYERLQKALLLIDFARIHTELGSSELASPRTSEADSLLQGLAAAHPNDPGWQRDVSIAYSKLGDLLKTQNRLEHAYAHYDASRDLGGPRCRFECRKQASACHQFHRHGRCGHCPRFFERGTVELRPKPCHYGSSRHCRARQSRLGASAPPALPGNRRRSATRREA